MPATVCGACFFNIVLSLYIWRYSTANTALRKASWQIMERNKTSCP